MIRIGILGYGNLGKGVELAVRQNDDMELAAVYTRRNPETVSIATPGVAVRSAADLEAGNEDIDVLILCGGSATDLPEQTPKYAALYNVVDSFDTHAKIPTHFANVDEAAKGAGKTALISCGWDPGLFSLNRLYANCILPEGADYTFWGRGVSQGHSDALRRIPGVADARQYTIPVPEALEAVRSGSNPELTTREKHTRECWVVLEEGADPAEVTKQIVEMPNYFDEYDVTVNFISHTAVWLSVLAKLLATRTARSNIHLILSPTPSSPLVCWLAMLALLLVSLLRATMVAKRYSILRRLIFLRSLAKSCALICCNAIVNRRIA